MKSSKKSHFCDFPTLRVKIDPIKRGKIAFTVIYLSHFNLNFDASNVENHKKKGLIFQNIEIDDLLNNWEKKVQILRWSKLIYKKREGF